MSSHRLLHHPYAAVQHELRNRCTVEKPDSDRALPTGSLGRTPAEAAGGDEHTGSAEHRVWEKWTTRERLAIMGGSAGGITVGRAMA
jgi:hypothetical protein